MSKVNPFRRAKPHLNPGDDSNKTRLICFALRHACDSGKISYAVFAAAKTMVEHRLGDNSTLRNWLEFEANVPYEELTHQALQAHRHAWLEILAVEWDKGIRR